MGEIFKCLWLFSVQHSTVYKHDKLHFLGVFRWHYGKQYGCYVGTNIQSEPCRTWHRLNMSMIMKPLAERLKKKLLQLLQKGFTVMVKVQTESFYVNSNRCITVSAFFIYITVQEKAYMHFMKYIKKIVRLHSEK